MLILLFSIVRNVISVSSVKSQVTSLFEDHVMSPHHFITLVNCHHCPHYHHCSCCHHCPHFFSLQFFITKNCDIQFCIHRALKNTTRVEAKRSCHGISGSARMAFQHSLHLMWYSVVFLLTSLVRWQIPISLLLTLQVSQVSFKIGLIPWLSIREVGSTGFGSL